MDKNIYQNTIGQASNSNEIPHSILSSSFNDNLGPRKPPEGDEGARGGTPPCLYSNNSTENNLNTCENDNKVETVKALINILTPYHKKQAHTLYLNVERLVTRVALTPGHVAFLTLTFQNRVLDQKEASERFNSMNTHFLKPSGKFGPWVMVKERQERRGKREGNEGALHFHAVVVLSGDIREGFDFPLYEWWCKDNNRFKMPCPTGNPYIRGLWKDLEQVQNYGFGKIFSLEPIHSCSQAIARYVGKYISKYIGQRGEVDRGARLVNYSRGWTRDHVSFAWNTPGAQEWRLKLKCFAMSIGCQELYQIKEVLGPNWAYKHANDIYNIFDKCEVIRDSQGRVFESPYLKRINENKKTREWRETKEAKISEKHRRDAEEKKRKTKEYMKELKLEYVQDWLSELGECGDIQTALDEAKKSLDDLHMKKLCAVIDNYRDEQSVWILKTGEVVPF